MQHSAHDIAQAATIKQQQELLNELLTIAPKDVADLIERKLAVIPKDVYDLVMDEIRPPIAATRAMVEEMRDEKVDYAKRLRDLDAHYKREHERRVMEGLARIRKDSDAWIIQLAESPEKFKKAAEAARIRSAMNKIEDQEIDGEVDKQLEQPDLQRPN